jgi:hypothetical protein
MLLFLCVLLLAMTTTEALREKTATNKTNSTRIKPTKNVSTVLKTPIVQQGEPIENDEEAPEESLPSPKLPNKTVPPQNGGVQIRRTAIQVPQTEIPTEEPVGRPIKVTAVKRTVVLKGKGDDDDESDDEPNEDNITEFQMVELNETDDEADDYENSTKTPKRKSKVERHLNRAISTVKNGLEDKVMEKIFKSKLFTLVVIVLTIIGSVGWVLKLVFAMK